MALSKKQRRALRAAKKDDKITKSESKQLKSLGIPKRQAAATVKNDKGGGKEKPKAWDANTGLVNSSYVTGLSNNQLINKAAKGQLFNGTPGSGNVGPVQSNSGSGGNNVQVVQAPVIPEYQGRGSGVYTDILQSLDEDAIAGLNMAKELRKRGIEQTDPRYDDLIAGLTARAEAASGWENTDLISRKGRKDLTGNKVNAFGLPELTKKEKREQNPYVVAPNGKTKYTGGEVDPTTTTTQPQGPSLDDLLLRQQEITDEKIKELETTYQQTISGLELDLEGLTNANDQWASANQFMQDQMLAANAAREAAEQRASNLRNAFVPQANPNAMSVLYGDSRRGGRRRQEDNQLSDLSILSGLGTNSNPLAGLQLA